MDGVIFIGLQGSGKSTYYSRAFHKTHLRLSMDMLKSRHREAILFNACLAAKQPVVIDNTNPSPADRARYIGLFRQARFRVTGYYFQSSIEQCMARNSLRTGKEQVPDIGIRSTFAKLVLPTLAEGFDALHYVHIDGNGSFCVEDWKNEI